MPAPSRSSMTIFAHEVIDPWVIHRPMSSWKIKGSNWKTKLCSCWVNLPTKVKTKPSMVKRNWLAPPGRACVWGPGVLHGVKRVVCITRGVAVVSRVEWSLMFLCFNDLKGQNKREYSYLKFPSWIKSFGWPASQLKTWLGTSLQAQDMFPPFGLAITTHTGKVCRFGKHRLIISLLRMLQAANEKLHPQKTPDQRAIICSSHHPASRPTTLKG